MWKIAARSNCRRSRGRDRRQSRLPRPRRLVFEQLEERSLLAVITVNSLVDGPPDETDGRTTLREALLQASSGDTIDVSVPGTVSLTHGELAIDADVTIRGNGLVVDAQQQSRVFQIRGDDRTVTFEQIVITNGLAGDYGGGVFAGGDNVRLTLVDSEVSGNRVEASPDDDWPDDLTWFYGGGIAIFEGTVTLTRTKVHGNVVAAPGGAAAGGGVAGGRRSPLEGAGFLEGTTSLVLEQSEVSGNLVNGQWPVGAGVLFREVTSNESQFLENQAHSSLFDNIGSSVVGGSIIEARSMSLVDSRLANNTAGTTVTADNATISGSSFEENTRATTVVLARESLVLTDSSVTRNQGSDLLGLWHAVSAPTVVVSRSQLRDNQGFAVAGGDRVVIRDSIIQGNEGGVTAVGRAVVSGSDVTDNGTAISVMGLHGAVSADEVTVTESNISGNRNGGVVGRHKVWVANSTIAHNQSLESGGGIGGYLATVMIVDSIVAANSSEGSGGGIRGKTVSVVRTEISGNSAGGSGGGISADTVLVDESRILGNNTRSWGGGIFGELVHVRNSVIRDNQAAGPRLLRPISGGGIQVGLHHPWAAALIENSHISRNRAEHGGGISSDGTLVLVATTLTDNESDMLKLDCPRNEYGRMLSDDEQACTVPAGHDIMASGDLYMNASTARSIYNNRQDVGRDGTELVEPPGDPPQTVIALIAETAPFPFGSEITLDASPSHRAETYQWDLNDDGQYDNATGPVVTLSWQEATELGLVEGVNRVGLRVRDDAGNTDETGTLIVIESQEDPHPEWLARVLAYSRGPDGAGWDPGTPIGYGGYVVDRVCDVGGFQGLGIARSEAAGSPSRDPILVIRGTSTYTIDEAVTNLLSDLNPGGIGYDLLQKNRDCVYGWFQDERWAGQGVSLVGHSLGGALAQWFAADYTGDGGTVGDVTTYNAPGISRNYAARFVPSAAGAVVHHLVNGDLVSMAGEAYIAGTNYLYSYSDWNPFGKHSRPLQIEQLPDQTQPEGMSRQEIATAALNSRWFHFTDPQYLTWVSGAQLLLPKLTPARLFFRGTTETLRQHVGDAIGQFLDAAQKGPVTFAAPITIARLPIVPGAFELGNLSVNWDSQAQSIDVTAALTVRDSFKVDTAISLLNHDLNRVAVEVTGVRIPLGQTGIVLRKLSAELKHFADSDERPVTFSGMVGGTFGPQVQIDVPAWLGGGTWNASLLELEGTLVVSADQFTLTSGPDQFTLAGNAVVVHPQVVTAEVSLEVDIQNRILAGSGSGSIFAGLVQGSATKTLSKRESVYQFEARGTASVAVPQGVWVIGGTQLADASYRLNLEGGGQGFDGSLRVEGSYDLPLVGVRQAGFEMTLDGQVTVWGFRRAADELPAAASRSLGPTDSVTASLLVVTWAEDADNPQATLVLPNGARISESQIADRSDIALVAGLSTPRQRVYSLAYAPDQIGQWTIEMSGVAGPVFQEVLVAAESPRFSFQGVQGGGSDPLQITFTLAQAHSVPTVSLYLDRQGGGKPSVPIAQGLTAADSPYSWNPVGLPSGAYRLSAVVEDGTSVPTRVDYEQPVQVETTPGLSIIGGQSSPAGSFQHFATRASAQWEPEIRQWTLHNHGSGPLELTQLDLIATDPSAFLVQWIDSRGRPLDSHQYVLDPGESLVVQVSFVAQTPGVKELSLHLQTNVPQWPSTVLSARGQYIQPAGVIERSTTAGNPVHLTLEELLTVPHGLQGLSVQLVGAAPTLHTHGSLQVQGEQDIIFTPSSPAAPLSAFTYTLIDEHGELAESAVHVSVRQSSPAGWQNPGNPLDVNDDGFISPIDALLVINHLNTAGSGPLPVPPQPPLIPPPYLDVSGDDYIAPIDALLVINFLNNPETGEGEPTLQLPDKRETNELGQGQVPSVHAGLQGWPSAVLPGSGVAFDARLQNGAAGTNLRPSATGPGAIPPEAPPIGPLEFFSTTARRQPPASSAAADFSAMRPAMFLDTEELESVLTNIVEEVQRRWNKDPG